MAEGNGLLNRRTTERLYRGFESRPLRCSAPSDVNEDCYVNFADFAEMAANWLKCNDVSNSNCQ